MTDTELEVRQAPPRETIAAQSREPRDERVTVIRPAARWPHLDLSELWHYRELLGRLVLRDIAVRYKQTSIGISWAIIQPLLTMVVFTFVFGRFANFPSKDIPYQVFVYSALLPWTYFASAVALSGTSLVTNRGLVTKVYFPRVLLPLAAVPSRLPTSYRRFSSSSGSWRGSRSGRVLRSCSCPCSSSWPLPPHWVSGCSCRHSTPATATSRYAVPFLMQIWLYLSGVVYAISALPERWQWVLALNPMTAVINGFQWGVVSTPAPELGKTLVSVAATAVFVLVGLWYFRRTEPRFADTI